MPELVEVLQRVPLFAGAGAPEVDALARCAEVREYRRDEVIIEAQQPGDGFYVIDSGRVKVALPAGEDRELILATLGDGEYFGEMALLDSEPRSATVTTQLPTRAFRISSESFAHLLDTFPQTARKLLRGLSCRLRRTNSQVESLVTLDVIGRLARYLIHLARSRGRVLGNGWVAVRRPTYREMASSIGSARETAIRLMARLERRGLVVIEGSMIYIRECVLTHEAQPMSV